MMYSLDVQSSSQVFRLCDVLHVAIAGPLACMKCWKMSLWAGTDCDNIPPGKIEVPLSPLL